MLVSCYDVEVDSAGAKCARPPRSRPANAVVALGVGRFSPSDQVIHAWALAPARWTVVDVYVAPTTPLPRVRSYVQWKSSAAWSTILGGGIGMEIEERHGLLFLKHLHIPIRLVDVPEHSALTAFDKPSVLDYFGLQHGT